MAVTVRVLFDYPQREIASILQDRFSKCKAAWLLSGFCTVEGIKAIAGSIRSDPTKLQTLIVGAGTYRAFEAFDDLINAGVPPDRLYVHLGHTRFSGATAKYPFYRYHPMLHSKVYLFLMPDGTASALIGSHNLTGFALLGLNGEAGVMIEGGAAEPELKKVRQHIDESRNQSVTYSPTMKEALNWWTIQFLEGLRAKANDQPRDGEAVRTIVILAATSVSQVPQKDDIIYFEIPEALGRIQSLSAEVHIYVFTTVPASPLIALTMLASARASLWCRTIGLEDEQGGLELRADWHVGSRGNPRLLRTPTPFRPTPTMGMQQVRVMVRNQVFDNFEYFFHSKRVTWEPILDQEQKIQVPADEQPTLRSLDLVPPEDREWYLVRGLRPVEHSGSDEYKEALREFSPESGSFILMSLWRRTRE
jgi:hypothetical protein